VCARISPPQSKSIWVRHSVPGNSSFIQTFPGTTGGPASAIESRRSPGPIIVPTPKFRMQKVWVRIKIEFDFQATEEEFRPESLAIGFLAR